LFKAKKGQDKDPALFICPISYEKPMLKYLQGAFKKITVVIETDD